MVWLKMDDQISHHPKFVAAGAIASWLWVCGNCHCNRYLTDGFIAENTLASLGVIPSPRKHAETLVKVGLWERVDQGYQVHDFLEHNPSREEVTNRRAEQHDAKVRGGQAASRQRQQKASSAANDVLEDESSRPIATRAGVPSQSPPLPSQSQTEEPEERAPALRAVRTGEDSRVVGEADENHAFRQLCVIAKKELLGLGLNESDFIEGLKERAARARLYYTGRLCQKAYDAVHAAANRRQPA